MSISGKSFLSQLLIDFDIIFQMNLFELLFGDKMKVESAAFLKLV